MRYGSSLKKESMLSTDKFRNGLVKDSTDGVDVDGVGKFNEWCTNVIGSIAIRNRLVGIAMGIGSEEGGKGVKVADSLRALELIASFGSARPMTKSIHASVTADFGNMSTKEMAKRAMELARKLGLDVPEGTQKVLEVVNVEEEKGGKEDGQEDGSKGRGPDDEGEAGVIRGEGGGSERSKGSCAKAYRGGKSAWDTDVRGEDIQLSE